MPKNQTLDEFYSTFREEVLCASDTETSGWTTEDFLTNVMMEYLEEAGEVTDPVICPFRGYGLQMNAYAISEDCESVDIFVSIYSESDRPRSVSQADIDAAIKRAIQLYHKAINDLYTAFQKDNDTYEFAITLHQNKDNIKHVRICALTNGLVKPIALKNITIGDAEISFSLWDVDRLYRCVTSGKMRETIETRSYNMSRIRGKDTKPEELVRKYLFSQGFRYRKNDARLPGKPDIVLPKYKTVIFVNGCFWHGHEGCHYFVWPKNNAEFWKKKIGSNIERDAKNHALLAKLGWNVIVVWECELKRSTAEETLNLLVHCIVQRQSYGNSN